MSLLPPSAYFKMQEVFDKYEACLKNRRVRKRTKENIQKYLEGEFAAKLQQFKILQGLSVRVCVLAEARCYILLIRESVIAFVVVEGQ